MKKRFKCLVFAAALILLISSAPVALAAGSFSNFGAAEKYNSQFTDVGNDWYTTYVIQGYELGLIAGSTPTTFSPNGNVTLAETITMAARVHSRYVSGAEPAKAAGQGGNWYDPYVTYAAQNGIVSKTYPDYNKPALRSEVAAIFAKALPAEALRDIRTVGDGTIPDVKMSADYAQAVYKLYRAGVLSGSDTKGTYYPATNIRRSEIAVILMRMADPSQRTAKALAEVEKAVLTPEQIAAKCSPAVFYVEMEGLNGNLRGTASGFLISSDGLAITNFHVVANTSGLTIQTVSGKQYNVSAVLAVDPDNDLALIKVDGSGFTALPLGDSASLKQGATVYAIGSPKGLDNTLSQGLISNPRREIGDGIKYIQTSAQITHGSSGGALINDRGEAVGVTSAGLDDAGADLNLAVPINLARMLDKNGTTSTPDLFQLSYYPGYWQAVDFGDLTGVRLLDYDLDYSYTASFTYDAFDFKDGESYAYCLYYYSKALLSQGFAHTGDDFDGVYKSDTEKVTVTIDLNDTRTILIEVERVPQYYEAFPKVIDFGWFTQLPLYDTSRFDDGAYGYWYYYSDYISRDDFVPYVEAYMTQLEKDGFVYKGNSGSSYLFEGQGASIIVNFDSLKVYIDILPI